MMMRRFSKEWGEDKETGREGRSEEKGRKSGEEMRDRERGRR